MSNISLPVAVILLGDPRRHRAVATKTGNGLKRGDHYVMLAVNWKGEVTVGDLTNPEQIVKGPKGQWQQMQSFDWPDTVIPVPANAP